MFVRKNIMIVKIFGIFDVLIYNFQTLYISFFGLLVIIGYHHPFLFFVFPFIKLFRIFFYSVIILVFHYFHQHSHMDPNPICLLFQI